MYMLAIQTTLSVYRERVLPRKVPVPTDLTPTYLPSPSAAETSTKPPACACACACAKRCCCCCCCSYSTPAAVVLTSY